MREDFEAKAGKEVTEKLRPATTAEYTDWIEKRIKSGRRINSVYNFNMRPDDIKIATARIFEEDLGGADRLSIIVPDGFRTAHTSWPTDRNKFLLMQNGECIANDWPYVVLFKDTVAELKKRGYSRRDLKKFFGRTPKWGRKDIKERIKTPFSEAPRASIKARLSRKIPGLHLKI